MVMLREELVRYEERRRVLRARINEMPRGTRQEISHDLRVHAVRISNVLNGVYINPRILERMEEWMSLQEA